MGTVTLEQVGGEELALPLPIQEALGELGELISRRLDDVRLAVMMIDGIDLGERTNVVALGRTTEGVKLPLGSGNRAPRTRARRRRCSPTWSSVASIPSRAASW